MGRIFQPARVPGAGVAAPDILSGAYTTGQDFIKGAVLIYTAAGELSEGGADPVADIAGVALEKAGSKPGFDAANSPTVVTGRVQEVSFAKANRNTVFSGRMENAAAVVTPTQTMINQQYGLLELANREWVVDETDTVNVSVEIVDIDVDQKIVFFKFIESVLATP